MQIGILGSGGVDKNLLTDLLRSGTLSRYGCTAQKKSRRGLQSTAGRRPWAAFGRADVWRNRCTFDVLGGTPSTLQLAGSKNFSGKVVVDLTNPLDFSTGMPQRLAAGHDYSGGETVQRLPPDAKVVNAFNIIGDLHIFRPDFSGGPQIIFIRGSDECEKKLATEISDAFDESWRHRGDRNVAPAGAARDAVDNKLFQNKHRQPRVQA